MAPGGSAWAAGGGALDEYPLLGPAGSVRVAVLQFRPFDGPAADDLCRRSLAVRPCQLRFPQAVQSSAVPENLTDSGLGGWVERLSVEINREVGVAAAAKACAACACGLTIDEYGRRGDCARLPARVSAGSSRSTRTCRPFEPSGRLPTDPLVGWSAAARRQPTTLCGPHIDGAPRDQAWPARAHAGSPVGETRKRIGDRLLDCGLRERLQVSPCGRRHGW